MKRAVLLCLFAVPALCAPLKVAVVGLRHGHAWQHLPNLVKGGPVQLVGVAEDIPAVIRRARAVGVAEPLIHGDWKKMINQLKPELVWSFVETNRHREIAEYCAPRKIHVMFEKPLTTTYADARAMQALARKHGVQVMTNWPVAWWPPIITAKSKVDAGLIGPVWRMHAVCSGPAARAKDDVARAFVDWLVDPEKNGGGALMDFGSYSALWSIWMMGKPQWVMAQSLHRQPGNFPTKVEDHATLLLGYANGVSILEGSWSLPAFYRDATITGTTGVLEMGKTKIMYRKGVSVRELPAENPPPERADPIAYVAHILGAGKSADGLLALDLNVASIEILEAAKRSIKTGQAARLPIE